MTRFFILISAAAVMTLAACSKETIDAPENAAVTCFDTEIDGAYGNVSGAYTVSVAINPTVTQLSDSQLNLTVKSTACNQVQVFFADNLSFSASCVQGNNGIITGANADASGEYTYNPTSKVITLVYTDANGGKYTMTGTQQ